MSVKRPHDVIDRWQRWADTQRRVTIGDGSGVSEEAYPAVLARFFGAFRHKPLTLAEWLRLRHPCHRDRSEESPLTMTNEGQPAIRPREGRSAAVPA
jgi:hypothetical protein